MPRNEELEMRDRAEQLSHLLASIPGVAGVCVYGSVARGTATHDSDIDVLVLGTNGDLTAKKLANMLKSKGTSEPLSLSYYRADDLTKYLKKWSRFAAHLRSEGWITHDPEGRLSHILSKQYPVSTKDELEIQRKWLDSYRHSERFGGRLLMPLARLYRIGRVATFARLAERGVLEFDQHRAFSRLAELEPGWRDELSQISRLEPFHSAVRDVPNSLELPLELPFDPFGTEAAREFETAHAAIQRIIDGQAQ